MQHRSFGERAAAADRPQHYKRDFWTAESSKFSQPHYRLEMAARIVGDLARGEECALLDVGCGPATLMRLLPANIRYFGIDIAIQDPAPNLIEADLLETPVRFDGQRFDIVLAQGVFEYLGGVQSQKFAEIAGLLNAGGSFVVSYWNFSHRRSQVYHAFSNVQSIAEFRADLSRFFVVDRFFPASHNWAHSEPSRKLVKAVNRLVQVNIPLISRALAVEYFFICSPRS